MALYTIRFVQSIPAASNLVWSFFADPRNLSFLTPPSMQFQTLSPDVSDSIYPGQLIEYRLRPLPWMHSNWLTEITQVSTGRYFEDQQRRGPYRLWHHQHHFKEIEGGVEMTDLVNYAIPYGPIGRTVNRYIVGPRLKELFRFRRQRIEEKFGRWPG
jgi:ligand-binding SRPBCC domain-containing protein